MCRVVNINRENYSIYIGRNSMWGNPYSISRSQSREEVIEKYRKYLWKHIQSGNITINHLLSLDGQVLGCHCKPKACHGDVLVRAVQWAKEQK
jgi:hypothetical protein